jgi:tRNA(Ile)-lysidine synthase
LDEFRDLLLVGGGSLFHGRMAQNLEQSVREAIQSQVLVSAEDRILLAVSGGADSVVMAAVLHRIQQDKPVCRGLAIGHVNHHLRGSESDGDEQFVRQLADQWNLPVLVRSVDVGAQRRSQKQSLETAARQLRLNALMDMASQAGCTRIATAHHADDQAETMIHRLQRGTGFRGLCGIAPTRRMDNRLLLIRPMLAITRGEILDYARRHGLSWHEDSSNVSIDHTRNRIRHLRLPELIRAAPRLGEQLCELAGHCQRFGRKVEDECERIRPRIIQSQQPGQIMLDRKAMETLPDPIRVELIRQALVELGCGEQNLGIQQFQSVDRLIHGPAGKSRNLPGGFCARTDSASLILARREPSRPAVSDDGVELPIPGKVVVGRFQIESRILSRDECDLKEFLKTKSPATEWFDFESIVPPLRIRRRRPGDRFAPLGQTEEKKIGKFLTAQKAADTLRRRILIVEDTRQILWAAPLRISHSVRIQSQTRRILEIAIRPAPNPSA